MLILLMLFRPQGIMGLREFRFLIPLQERSEAIQKAREAARAQRRIWEVRS
jgi:hypothetical protein